MIDVAQLDAGWRPLLKNFLNSNACVRLHEFLDRERAAKKTIYPPRPLRALELTRFESVRAVILGQDPYHGAGQAHGLAFSVPDGVRVPPSLANIFAELRADLGCAMPASGNLERWAREGVLLTNAVFTVEHGRPGSHAGAGWEHLTRAIVDVLARDSSPKVFLLWGAQAQAFAPVIAAAGRAHLVLTSNHPSPLSARRPPQPYLGCRHFSQTNDFLVAHGRGAIRWCE